MAKMIPIINNYAEIDFQIALVKVYQVTRVIDHKH